MRRIFSVFSLLLIMSTISFTADISVSEITCPLYDIESDLWDALHSKTFSVSAPKLRNEQFLRAALMGSVNGVVAAPEDLLTILDYHVARFDETAMQLKYRFLKNRFGKLNIENADEAATMLHNGLSKNQLWAYQEKINLLTASKAPIEDVLPYHVWISNRKGVFTDEKKNEVINASINVVDAYLRKSVSALDVAERLHYGTAFYREAYALKRTLHNVGLTNKTRDLGTKIKNYTNKAVEFGCFSAINEAIQNRKTSLLKRRDLQIRVADMGHLSSAFELAQNIAIDMPASLPAKNFDEKEAAKVIHYFTMAIDGGNKDALEELGTFFTHRKNYTDAFRYLHEARLQGVKTARMSIAKLYAAQGLHDEAIAEYKLSGEEGNPYHASLAYFLFEIGRDIEALEIFLAIDPQTRFMHRRIAQIYSRLKDYENALTYYQTFLKDEKWEWAFELNAAGLAAEQLNRHDEAYNYFKRCVKTFSSTSSRYRDLNNQCSYNRARLEQMSFKSHSANIRKAMKYYRRAADYNYAPAMEALARQHIILGHHKHALLALLKLEAVDKDAARNLRELMDNSKAIADDELVRMINTSIVPAAAVANDDDAPTKAKDDDSDVVTLSLSRPIADDVTSDSHGGSDSQEEQEQYPSFADWAKLKNDQQFLRDQIALMNQANAMLQAQSFSSTDLTDKNQTTWLKLMKGAAVTLGEIIAICEDPLLQTYISHSATKSGMAYTIKVNGMVCTGGDHKKHNKSYKGVDQNFRQDFRTNLKVMFGFN